MPSSPTISVIIPAWNAAATLPAALRSVVDQGRDDLEVLVIDDGSTDSTASAAAAFGPPVRLLQLSRGGVSRARNAGLRASTGRFVAFLDADDTWHPGKLAVQLHRFADPEVGLVFSDLSVQHADGRFLPSYLAARPLAGEGWLLERYLQSRFLFPSTVVLRRTALDQTGWFDEDLRGAEDLELFARILVHWRAAFCREVLVVRHEGPETLSANRELMLDGMIQAFRRIGEREPSLSPRARTLLRQQIGQHLLWSSSMTHEGRSPALAWHELWASLHATPLRSLLPATRIAGGLLRHRITERFAHPTLPDRKNGPPARDV